MKLSQRLMSLASSDKKRGFLKSLLPKPYGDLLAELYTRGMSTRSAHPLFQLKAEGKYKGVLQPPPKYKLAWRLLYNIPTPVARQILNLTKLPSKGVAPSGGVLAPKKGKLEIRGGDVQWWSTTKSGLVDTHGDVGPDHYVPNTYVILVESLIHENPDAFIGNPDKVNGWSDSHDYDEIVSVGPVSLGASRYMKVTADDDETWNAVCEFVAKASR